MLAKKLIDLYFTLFKLVVEGSIGSAAALRKQQVGGSVSVSVSIPGILRWRKAYVCKHLQLRQWFTRGVDEFSPFLVEVLQRPPSGGRG